MARSEELEVIPSSDSRSETDDGFCRGPYFDYDLSWNTTNPNLTQCFMDTTLIGIPSIAFWILSTVWIGYQYHANKKRSSKGIYNYCQKGMQNRRSLKRQYLNDNFTGGVQIYPFQMTPQSEPGKNGLLSSSSRHSLHFC